MKKRLLLNKCPAFGIILLFIGTCIIPTFAQNTEKSSVPASRGSWLYVGGSGPGNYSRINDALDNASNGDTIFVYDDSAPYHEVVSIDKSVTVQGENRETTVIESNASTSPINLYADGIVFMNFTIIAYESGIRLYYTNDTTVSSCNILTRYGEGLIIAYSSRNIISNISIHFRGEPAIGYFGVWIYGNSIDNIVTYVTVESPQYDIDDRGFALGGSGNRIEHVVFLNCSFFGGGLEFENNVFISNSKDGKPIVVLKEATSGVVTDASIVVLIDCSNVSIQNITTSKARIAILLYRCHDCTVASCTISQSKYGMYLQACQRISLLGCTIEYGPQPDSELTIGIAVYTSNDCTLKDNVIVENSIGMLLEDATKTLVSHNLLRRNYNLGFWIQNGIGIGGAVTIDGGSRNVFTRNTFLGNIIKVVLTDCGHNTWLNNYWGRPKLLPKVLLGLRFGYDTITPFVQMDWRPALFPTVTGIANFLPERNV
jgi:parallel beta-helix repeat protein